MTDIATHAALAADFPPATRAQWRALVDRALKGADFERTLRSTTYDGLTIEPLYEKAAENPPRALRGQPGPWRVTQRVDHPDPAEANALALADVEGGADGLALVLAGAPSARGYGLSVRTIDDIERALADVRLDLVHLRVEAAPFMGRRTAALLAALVERRGHAAGDLSVDFGLDPIGDMARAGSSPLALDEMARRLAGTAGALAKHGFRHSLVRIDGRPVHEAGGSQAQELAYALAAGIAYLRALEAGGFPLEAARDALGFLLVADAEQFLTLAKFRAMRRLWARVEEACGLDPKPIRIEAETAWRMTSRRDPFVNMLRATIATCAAGLGGADGVTVLPFTAALGLPDAFARRMARNTQLILIEESHLARVADPAAGAGGFEALTAALAERAWVLAQRIEASGGLPASLGKDHVQADIAKTRVDRVRAIRRREEALTGASEFPNIAETPVAVLTPERPTAPGARPGPQADLDFGELVGAARDGEILGGAASPSELPAQTFEPLPSHRDAEPFERLRDASDARLAKSGEQPRIFLANMGLVAGFTAKATFARNFFESGGVVALTNDGFPEAEAAAEAFRESGARLACICSSDEVHTEVVPTTAEALERAGATLVYVTGKPQNLHESLRDRASIRYIFAGCDAPSALEEALERA